MKKTVTLALVLLLSACAQIPAPTTASNTAPANKMCANCPCCQQRMHHGSAMQGGMMMPNGATQSCQMCARMQQQGKPTPSGQQTNDHLQHHSPNP